MEQIHIGEYPPQRRIANHQDLQDGLKALLAMDPRLQEIAALAGELPLRLATPDFAGLASIIISQQLSRASAQAISGRLTGLLGPLEAANVLAAGEEALRQAGVSGAKQRTLLALAGAVHGGTLDLGRLGSCSTEEAISQLTAIRGIGPWTAEVYLMFCEGHCDIFPAQDLALRESVRLALNLDERPHEKTLREMAQIWSPWRSVAARLLWAFYGAARTAARASSRQGS